MINIRFPNITAQTEKGQLEQIRSYLYQFAQELNWAMANIDSKAEEATKKIVASTQQKDAVEQAQATFAEVKSLIIKSADIVNAYSEEISHRLDGIYVAQSEFGTYKEQTSATLEANSKAVSLEFKNHQELIVGLDGRVGTAESGLAQTNTAVDGLGTRLDDNITDIKGGLNEATGNIDAVNTALTTEQGKVTELQSDMVSAKESIGEHGDRLGGVEKGVGDLNTLIAKDGETTVVRSTNAWCKIGLLEETEDGVPIYGMEIGQITTDENEEELFNAFARYCSDGVHLYDQNGSEVATVNNNKITITNAEIANVTISDTLVMGGYEISVSNGLTFKWKGV